MITVVTGVPGAGKTAYTVAQLIEELKKRPRPLFALGVTGLKLDHEVCPEISAWTEAKPLPEDPSVIEHEFVFPDGALIVVDEAQKILRPRASGAKVPPYVQAFEKHRHKGLDFWLITQNPALMDQNVRRLVGRHIHLRSAWNGRTLYEWAECANPESASDRASAVTRSYRLPRHVFDQYTSASVHVAQPRRLPRALLVLVLALLVGSVLAYRLGSDIYAQASGQASSPSSVAGSPSVVVAAGQAAVAPVSSAPVNEPAGASLEDFRPRILARPETAPLYDELRKPKVMPRVAGCIASRTGCKCYTQQAGNAFVPEHICRAWAVEPPFNPWQAPPEPAQVARSVEPEQALDRYGRPILAGSSITPVAVEYRGAALR